MSDLAPILQGFFTDRMITQKQASEHTIRSYRDTWRLLLAFAQDATGTPPWKLDIGQLDATLITSFLHWLETSRNCSPSTRNARLSAMLDGAQDADDRGGVAASGMPMAAQRAGGWRSFVGGGALPTGRGVRVAVRGECQAR